MKEGSVILDGGLHLDNICASIDLQLNFYITINLIDASNYIVRFNNALYVIQDCRTRMLIVSGEPTDGLYLFIYLLGTKVHALMLEKGFANENVWRS